MWLARFGDKIKIKDITQVIYHKNYQLPGYSK